MGHLGIISLIIALAVFGSRAWSAGSQNLICTNPYAFICGSDGAVQAQRSSRIEVIGKQISDAALVEAKKVIPSGTGFRFTRIYYSKLREQVRSYLKVHHLPSDLNFKPIQVAFTIALQEFEGFEPGVKTQMLEVVKKLKFINVAELPLEHFKANRGIELESKRGCGSDGMNDNAFAAVINDIENVVVVCPGAIIAAIEFAGAEKLAKHHLLAGIVMTIGHEIAHHVDTESFANSYARYSRCVDSTLGPWLEKEPSAYMREIIADTWGTKVLASYIGKEKNVATRLKIMRGSLDDLCEQKDDPEASIDDGEHPSGAFRLEEIVIANKQIADSLMCTAPLKPLCEM